MNTCECSKSIVPPTIKPPSIRIVDQHHRVGCNVMYQGTVMDTLQQSGIESSHCVQFYLGPTNRYSCELINNYDRLKSIDYCDLYGKNFYIHSPNNTNLARDSNHNILKATSKIIQKELHQIRDMPAGCIVHIGAKGNVHNVINNINDMQIRRGSHHRVEKQLILENAAGAGTKLGWNWDQLRHIYEGIDRSTVGLCLDTQHIFAAGTNSLQNHEEVIKMFDKSLEIYGKNPDVIHLNDSKVEFGRRVDRHEGLKTGYIWSQSDEGLKSLLNYCYDQDIDVILETPTSQYDLVDIRNNYMELDLL